MSTVAAQYFRVPFGLELPSHRLTPPASARPKTAYFCPLCEVPLVFKHGNIVTHHFAHKASSTCTSESVKHRIAKLLIAQVVTDFVQRRGPRPVSLRPCACGRRAEIPLPTSVTDASVEYRLSSGHIADVALMKRSEILGLVEIRVTHAVPDDKIQALTVPWIELLADTVLENPLLWIGVRHGQSRVPLCERCSRASAEIARLIQAWKSAIAALATRDGIDLPGDPYEIGIHRCFRCPTEMLVFRWSRQLWPVDEPPSPIPKTVCRRACKQIAGHYWANTCPNCKYTQSDRYLKVVKPDGDPWKVRWPLWKKEPPSV